MTILTFLCTVSFVVTAAVCLYHLALAVAALCASGRDSGCGTEPASRFAVVIPAHNEEGTIEFTLRCCDRMDYPKAMYRVYVVADNCTDRTAEVATARGATCLVRDDPCHTGKGCALEWALPQVLADGWDAVFVLDADCEVGPDALRRFDARLRAGDRVLQASCAVANPDETAMTYVLALANVLENDLFYSPKSRLGLAVFLRGTGMALHREVLLAHPWRARSIVEDVEYACQLLEAGIAVRFVPEVQVVSRCPVRPGALSVQRSRWIGGSVLLGKRQALRLMWRGLCGRRPVLLDAALTLLVVSRPLVILQWATTMTLAVLCAWWVPGSWSRGLLVGSLACAAMYGSYLAAGMWRLGLTRGRIRLAMRAPMAVLRYVVLAMRAIVKTPPGQWKRTPRIHEAP